MGTARLFFDPSCHGNMLFLGSADPVFRGSTSYLNMEEPIKKRPFFSSSDEFLEEEYYDEQLPEKKRRLTPEQVHLLEKSFETENKLEPERKTELAKTLGLQPRQVAVWFQNRRARWKTKQLERDYDILKASYDSLRSDYDTIVKENEKLKLELKEVAGIKSNQTSDSELAAEANVDVTTDQINIKVEDRLSSRSGESAVIDEEYLQRIDSVDSYFPNTDYNHCIGAVDGQSEEDDISDNSQSYFSDVFAAASAADQNPQEEAATLGWWVWS